VIHPGSQAMRGRTGREHRPAALGRRVATALASLLLAALAGTVLAQEALSPTLREEVLFIDKPGRAGVRLETTLFRPPGDGPFPLVIINHGKEPGDPHQQARGRFVLAARELLSRGYAVAVPMRQGFADSTGPYLSDGCDIEANAKAQARDVLAALAALSRRPDIDASRTIVMGQSHGGLATMALESFNPKGVAGLVNFAGGLRLKNCDRWRTELTRAMAAFGAGARLPSLWFYGDNDQTFDSDLWQAMFKGYTQAGGQARLIAFGTFGDDAHKMFASGPGLRIWVPAVGDFLRGLGLPFDVKYRIVVADHETPPPPSSGFAAIGDAARIPFVDDRARAAWTGYLDAAPPKAFALSPRGNWYYRYGDPAAMRTALEQCGEREPRGPCQLYAVDDAVVWHAAAPAPHAKN